VRNGLSVVGSRPPSDVDQQMFTPLTNTTPSAITAAWDYNLAVGSANPFAWPGWPQCGSLGQDGSSSLGTGQLDPLTYHEHVEFSLTSIASVHPRVPTSHQQAVDAPTILLSQDIAIQDLEYSVPSTTSAQAMPVVTVSPPSYLRSSVPVVQSHASSNSASHRATVLATEVSVNSYSVPLTMSTSSRNSTALMECTMHCETPHGLMCDRIVRMSTSSEVAPATQLLKSPNSATALGPAAASPCSAYSTRAPNKKLRHVNVCTEKEHAMSDPHRTRMFQQTTKSSQEGDSSSTSPLVEPLSHLMHCRSSPHVHTDGEGSSLVMSSPFTLPRASPKGGVTSTPSGRNRGVKRDVSGLSSGGRAQLSPSALISGCEPLPLPTEEDGVITGSGNGLAEGVTISKPVPGKRGGGFSCHCCKTSKRNIAELFLCTNILPKDPQSDESVRAAKLATEALWRGKTPSQGHSMEDDDVDSYATTGQKKCKKKYCLQSDKRLEGRINREQSFTCVFLTCYYVRSRFAAACVVTTHLSFRHSADPNKTNGSAPPA
jgi:hypothetical protein